MYVTSGVCHPWCMSLVFVTPGVCDTTWTSRALAGVILQSFWKTIEKFHGRYCRQKSHAIWSLSTAALVGGGAKSLHIHNVQFLVISLIPNKVGSHLAVAYGRSVAGAHSPCAWPTQPPHCSLCHNKCTHEPTHKICSVMRSLHRDSIQEVTFRGY